LAVNLDSGRGTFEGLDGRGLVMVDIEDSVQFGGFQHRQDLSWRAK
jgi:hypothetical protein